MAPGTWVRSPLLTPKDQMELRIYTDELEKHLLHTLSNLYAVATFSRSIQCQIKVTPNATDAYVEWVISGIKPSNVPASLDWANDVHKRLRLFPSSRYLQVKYNFPRTYWKPSGYGYYIDGSMKWETLAHNAGMQATGEASIPVPAAASKLIAVQLNWTYKAPLGYI